MRTNRRLTSFGFWLLVAWAGTALFAAPAEPVNEAGFMEIEPVTFHFHFGSYLYRLQLTSSRARIWYSFHAADADGPGVPLFVFFNGGPGSATSSGLMSMYTGRWTLDNRVAGGGAGFIANPHTWTRMGHLLYIDARQAGFSYNLAADSGDVLVRLKEFNAQNFNSFFDAADFIRVLLRFLAAHGPLRGRPVVIVGESYGGTRTIAMMHMLLHYPGYGDGREIYQDPALAEEIQAHLDAVFPGWAGQPVPPEVIGRQFGHQLLIQPTVSFGFQQEVTEEMLRQPGSVLYRIAAETGVPYDPALYPTFYDFVEAAGRDYYIYSKPVGWLNSFFANAGVLLRTTANLAQLCGCDVRAVPGLYATERDDAYRVINAESQAAAPAGRRDADIARRFAMAGTTGAPPPPAALRESSPLTPQVPPSTRLLFLNPAEQEAALFPVEPGDMEAVFGGLHPWDRFFMGSNGDANWAFHVANVAMVHGYDIYYYDARFGSMFLDNAAHVRTFITNAALDLVVYTAALPAALGRHDGIVASVRHDTGGADPRPGRIVLQYRPGAVADASGVTERTIRFPSYPESCHAVSLTQPGEFYDDVCAWLREGGIIGAGR